MIVVAATVAGVSVIRATFGNQREASTGRVLLMSDGLEEIQECEPHGLGKGGNRPFGIGIQGEFSPAINLICSGSEVRDRIF